MKEMEEAVEKIVKAAKAAVQNYGGDDQYWIYEEVIHRLQDEERMALQVEYLGKEVEEDEQ